MIPPFGLQQQPARQRPEIGANQPVARQGLLSGRVIPVENIM
jgi:hypothetical protein